MSDQPIAPATGDSENKPVTPEPVTPEPTNLPDAPESDKKADSKPRKKTARRSTKSKLPLTSASPKRPRRKATPEDTAPPPETPTPPVADIPSPSLRSGRDFSHLFLLLTAIALAVIYMLLQFRGLSSPAAMDQAQIARHIAEGKGFSTAYIRPLALWQLETAGKPIPHENFPDFFHSPLNPLLNALPLQLVRAHWKLTPIDIVYIGDRAIAILGVTLFIAALSIWYFVALRLFSRPVALLGTIILLVTDLLWQFSISGLPQMLALLLFGATAWLTLLSLETSTTTRRLVLIGSAGICLGFAILTHAAIAWILPGWVFLLLLSSPPRIPTILAALAAVTLIVSPWLVRNHAVSGSPLGLAGYELVAPANTSETGYMRNLYNPPKASASKLLARFQQHLATQIDSLFSLLGANITAFVFFISLLHRFDSATANRFRWPLLAMWIGATLGMILCGTNGPLSPNNLHILFLPLFVFYGVAFLRHLLTQITLPHPRLAQALAIFLVFLCGLPMWNTLLANKPPVQWPPYVPPFIAILGEWYDKNEIIASDMPWAVAWYAQRKSLLLPQTIKDFNRISDYRVLGDAITGLYLTPLTGDRRLFTEIYKGPYTDWVLQITRPPVVAGFPLPVFTPLPIDGECILFADRDRWSRRE